MKQTLCIISILITSYLLHAQKPSQENYEKLKALAVELKQEYEAEKVKIAGYQKSTKKARTTSTRIISGFRPSGRPIYTIDHNTGAATATRTIDLYPGGKLANALTGKGMIVGIWENGGATPFTPGVPREANRYGSR